MYRTSARTTTPDAAVVCRSCGVRFEVAFADARQGTVTCARCDAVQTVMREADDLGATRIELVNRVSSEAYEELVPLLRELETDGRASQVSIACDGIHVVVSLDLDSGRVRGLELAAAAPGLVDLRLLRENEAHRDAKERGIAREERWRSRKRRLMAASAGMVGHLDPGSASEPTLPPDTLPPATTTTTIVIPDVVDDPQCRMAKAVIEGLRFITGPDGTAPANLAAGAAKYREAADIALNSGLPGTAPVALLTAQIAVDLPGARTPAEVEAIYQRLSAPTDPAIIPVAQAFAAHLREACPDLIRVEP